jgi:tol-pal system-associated acyl-CoA thioesterase
MEEFCMQLRVYYEDTDAEGVVYYANYLKFLERARTEALRHLGFEQSVLGAEGLAFAVSKLNIHYQKAAKLDDWLDVTFEVVKQKFCSLTCKQQIKRAGQLLASAEVLLVFVSTKNFSPQRIPEKIAKLFS